MVQILDFLQTYRIDIAVGVMLVVLLFIFRKTKVAKSIVKDALCEIERKINSDLAQKAIDQQIAELRKDKEIPFFIRKCVTKHMIISIMEKSMNVVAQTCDINKEYDLKGNESDVSVTKVELDKESLGLGVKYEEKADFNVKNDNKTTILYAELNAKTDFKGKDSAQISVGIKKKI